MPWKEKEISGARLSFVACGGAFNEKSTRVLVTRTRPPEFSLIFSTRMSHDFTTREERRHNINNNNNTKTKQKVKKSSSRNFKKDSGNKKRARAVWIQSATCVCCVSPRIVLFYRRSEWEMSRVDGMMDDNFFFFCLLSSFHLFNIQHRQTALKIRFVNQRWGESGWKERDGCLMNYCGIVTNYWSSIS